MNENQFIDLVNKEIDDIISLNEKKDLHEYLDTHPEAMKKYQELILTARTLNKLDKVEPPEYLKSQIMNSIDLNRYTVKQKKNSFFNFPIFDWLFYPKPKFALSFATGTIFGLLLFALFFSDIVESVLFVWNCHTEASKVQPFSQGSIFQKRIEFTLVTLHQKRKI